MQLIALLIYNCIAFMMNSQYHEHNYYLSTLIKEVTTQLWQYHSGKLLTLVWMFNRVPD